MGKPLEFVPQTDYVALCGKKESGLNRFKLVFYVRPVGDNSDHHAKTDWHQIVFDLTSEAEADKINQIPNATEEGKNSIQLFWRREMIKSLGIQIAEHAVKMVEKYAP